MGCIPSKQDDGVLRVPLNQYVKLADQRAFSFRPYGRGKHDWEHGWEYYVSVQVPETGTGKDTSETQHVKSFQGYVGWYQLQQCSWLKVGSKPTKSSMIGHKSYLLDEDEDTIAAWPGMNMNTADSEHRGLRQWVNNDRKVTLKQLQDFAGCLESQDTNNGPKKTTTVFDWDNTLCPTVWFKKQQAIMRAFEDCRREQSCPKLRGFINDNSDIANELNGMFQGVNKVLDQAKKSGNVVIVTNFGNARGVANLAEVFGLDLKGVGIFSASAMYDKFVVQSHGYHITCKVLCFKDLVQHFDLNKENNLLVSVGDGNEERLAITNIKDAKMDRVSMKLQGVLSLQDLVSQHKVLQGITQNVEDLASRQKDLQAIAKNVWQGNVVLDLKYKNGYFTEEDLISQLWKNITDNFKGEGEKRPPLLQPLLKYVKKYILLDDDVKKMIEQYKQKMAQYQEEVDKRPQEIKQHRQHVKKYEQDIQQYQQKKKLNKLEIKQHKQTTKLLQQSQQMINQYKQMIEQYWQEIETRKMMIELFEKIENDAQTEIQNHNMELPKKIKKEFEHQQTIKQYKQEIEEMQQKIKQLQENIEKPWQKIEQHEETFERCNLDIENLEEKMKKYQGPPYQCEDMLTTDKQQIELLKQQIETHKKVIEEFPQEYKQQIKEYKQQNETHKKLAEKQQQKIEQLEIEQLEIEQDNPMIEPHQHTLQQYQHMLQQYQQEVEQYQHWVEQYLDKVEQNLQKRDTTLEMIEQVLQQVRRQKDFQAIAKNVVQGNVVLDLKLKNGHFTEEDLISQLWKDVEKNFEQLKDLAHLKELLLLLEQLLTYVKKYMPQELLSLLKTILTRVQTYMPRDKDAEKIELDLQFEEKWIELYLQEVERYKQDIHSHLQTLEQHPQETEQFTLKIKENLDKIDPLLKQLKQYERGEIWIKNCPKMITHQQENITFLQEMIETFSKIKANNNFLRYGK